MPVEPQKRSKCDDGQEFSSQLRTRTDTSGRYVVHDDVQAFLACSVEEIKWLEDSTLDIVKWHLLCRNVDHLVRDDK